MASAQEANNDHNENSIVVTGVNAPVTTSTGLELTFMETPQSVTVIDQERLRNFALTSIRDVLTQTVGVTVEQYETERTFFTSRGFDVTNFQIDGIGLPLMENVLYGDTDSFLYERIDIVRGANGLTTGIGNPSATVNYIRKRPYTDGLHVNAGIYGGSWDRRRAEADISVPLGENWAVRLLGVHEQADSYLQRYKMNRDVAGIVISGKLTPELTLTAGYHIQDNDSDSPTWVSPLIVYSDGTFIPNRRSTNNAPEWSFWDITEQQAYAELAYEIDDWTVKGILTHRRYRDNFQIVNHYGFPDRTTGTGLNGDSSRFRSTNRRLLADMFATGKVSAFGQEHQLTFGVSYGRARQKTYQGRATPPTDPLSPGFGIPGYVEYDFNAPDPYNVPEPTYLPFGLQHNQTDKLTRLYAAAQISFTDYLKTVAGVSWTKSIANGVYFGEIRDTNYSKLNPYVGLLADVTPFLTAYASYTTIFNPQTQPDINRRQLAPVEGTNMEAGLKANLFNKRFYVNAAVFKTKQKGIAVFAGQTIDTTNGFEIFSYYEPEDITSKGFEFELAGKVTRNWSLSGGFTTLKMKNTIGTKPQPHIPREMLKASTTYEFPELNNLAIGAQLRWQSSLTIPVDGYGPLPANPVLREGAYAILDLMTGVDIVENVRATLNVRNVTNKLHYTTLIYASYGYGLYAPGRNVTASLSYRF